MVAFLSRKTGHLAVDHRRHHGGRGRLRPQ
jgi:hypothetical protein